MNFFAKVILLLTVAACAHRVDRSTASSNQSEFDVKAHSEANLCKFHPVELKDSDVPLQVYTQYAAETGQTALATVTIPLDFELSRSQANGKTTLYVTPVFAKKIACNSVNRIFVVYP